MAARKPASPRAKPNRKQRQPKTFNRPSAVVFRAGARRLDELNNMGPRRKAPILHLSSDSEQSNSDTEAVTSLDLLFGPHRCVDTLDSYCERDETLT
jgi:hypothetical protein